MSYLKEVNVHSGTDLGHDAWGLNKVSTPKSMLSALFNYDVPAKMLKEMEWNGVDDYVEQPTFTYATSVEGSLHLTTSATVGSRIQLRTKEHVRYQPNRGFHYATSVSLPNPNSNTIRKFGALLPCNGVYFELVGNGTSSTLYFVIKNHFVPTPYDLTDYLPEGLDLSMLNLFDFQMQWRGAGDYKVFVNKKLIFSTNDLGTRTKVSVENPSLPIGYEVENTGDTNTIVCGCSDISMDGGDDIKSKYDSFSTGVNLLTCSNNGGDGTALIAIRMPYKISYGGDDVCYSRDAILDQISTFCKDEAVVAVYGARGIYLSSIPSLTWNNHVGEFIEYALGGNGSALDTAFQADKANMREITVVRQEKDFALRMVNPSPKQSPFALTADSYIVVQLIPDGAGQGAGVTVEVSEQI